VILVLGACKPSIPRLAFQTIGGQAVRHQELIIDQSPETRIKGYETPTTTTKPTSNATNAYTIPQEDDVEICHLVSLSPLHFYIASLYRFSSFDGGILSTSIKLSLISIHPHPFLLDMHSSHLALLDIHPRSSRSAP